MRKRNPEAGHTELDLLFSPWFWAILAVVAAVSSLSYPFLTSVDRGEIVIRDCDGDLTVWRYPKDEGVRWDGFCGVTTYYEIDSVSFKEPVVVDGRRFTVRGTVRFPMPADDAEMRALHEEYGSRAALVDKLVMPAVMAAIHDAAADPTWAQPQGNYVERKLKGAFDYGLKRVSPTGAIWTSHETRQRLQEDLNKRLAFGTPDPGLYDKPLRRIPLTIELGFVTER